MIQKLEYLLSLPKSIYVCFRLFQLKDALKLPMLVRYNCRLHSLVGTVDIDADKIRFGMCKVGFAVVGIFDKTTSPAILKIKGRITLKGTASFGQGSRICVGSEGHLTIGKEFLNTAEGAILCFHRIVLGNKVLVSWNTTIMDTDFHAVRNLQTGKVTNPIGEVVVGNDVWIGMGSTLLKNTVVPDGCIIGAQTLLNKAFTEPNTLLAGNPGIVKKRNVCRQKEEWEIAIEN